MFFIYYRLITRYLRNSTQSVKILSTLIKTWCSSFFWYYITMTKSADKVIYIKVHVCISQGCQ